MGYFYQLGTLALRHVVNPSNGLVSMPSVNRYIMPYPSTSSFNNIRVISGGSVFAAGSYIGPGGKKIAVVESSWTGLNCLTTSETYQTTLSLTPPAGASTIVQNTLTVTTGPLSSYFTSFILPSNASLVLFALQQTYASCPFTPITLIDTQVQTTFSCYAGLLCSMPSVAIYSLSNTGCTAPQPIEYSIYFQNGTQIIYLQTMALDTVTFSFTPSTSDVGTQICNVYAYLFDGNTLITQNTNVIVTINVQASPCLTDLRFSAI